MLEASILPKTRLCDLNKMMGLLSPFSLSALGIILEKHCASSGGSPTEAKFSKMTVQACEAQSGRRPEIRAAKNIERHARDLLT